MNRSSQLLLKLFAWAAYAWAPPELPPRDPDWPRTAADEVTESERQRELEARLFMLTWM